MRNIQIYKQKRRSKSIILILCGILVLSLTITLLVFADLPEGWQFVGENFQITNITQVMYEDAVYGDNKYLVVWDKNNYVQGQFISVTGSKIGSVFNISEQQNGSAPRVAYHKGSGRWFVTWTDWRNDSVSSSDIYGRILESDGTPVGSDIAIWTELSTDQWSWAEAVPSGFFVVFEADKDIYAKMISTAGALGDSILISDAFNMQEQPAISYAEEYDKILVAWNDYRNIDNDTDSDIYGQFLNGSGSLIGSNFAIHEEVDYQTTARAAYSPVDDSFLVIFDDQRLTGSREISAQKIGIDGANIGSVIYVNDVDHGHDEFPDIAYNANIDKYIGVWTDGSDVYGQIFDSDSTQFGSDLTLSNAVDSQCYISVTEGPGSTFLAVWFDKRTGNSEVWGQIISGTPVAYSPDIYIKNQGEDDTKYVLKDEQYCGTFVTLQTKEQSVTNADKAIYYITIKQDGTNNGDIISVTGIGDGSAGGGNWTVKYYEVTSESDPGVDRTSEIVSTGYGYTLASGGKQLIRAEVTPDSNVASGTSYAITIQATSPTLPCFPPPNPPIGPTSGNIGASHSYSIGKPYYNLGDSIQYLFDWGDGSDSGWLAVGTASASKSWTSEGTYIVKAQARFATHTDKVSDWSSGLSVTIPDWSVIAAGYRHTIALKPDGSLWAWGFNDCGQLGDGTNEDKDIPTSIGTGYSAIAAGGNHTVALKPDGSLWEWGFDGISNPNIPTSIGTDYSAIAAGYRHTIALKSDGSIWTWGQDLYGQLGGGSSGDTTIPTSIGTGYSAIAAGANHTVALKSDGSLWAWGANYYGQLGDGTNEDKDIPTYIGTGYSAIAVGTYHTVALKPDGSLWAWGFNDCGQLGDGTTASKDIPTYIGTGYSAIAAGAYHTVALKSDGSLWAWGSNGYGQLGDGTTASKNIPTYIGTGYSAIAASTYYTVVLKLDGSFWTWGANEWGFPTTAPPAVDSSRKDVVRAITTAIEGEETIAGSSGENSGSRHHKHKTWKCGLLGIEPFILLGIVRLMRKRRAVKKHKNLIS